MTTTANWAAKTANWLKYECDVEPGVNVAVCLPAHWQTVGVLLGAWWCGARVTDEPADAAVAFIPPHSSIPPHRSNPPHSSIPSADVTAIVALDPLGRGLSEPAPSNTYDFLAEVHAYGDTFGSEPISGNAKAFQDSSVDELVASARSRAQDLGITAGARVMSTMAWTYPDGLMTGLLAVLAGQASLVQSDPVDPAKLAARQETERTTISLG